MKTNHTPGPWIAESTGQKGRSAASHYIKARKEKGAPTVAHVKNSPRLPVKANALLIAAAPDLLAECVKLRASIRHSNTCKGPQAFPCTCDADALWESSAAAIAKAVQS